MISITQMEDELNKVEYECMEELEMGHIEKNGSMELLKKSMNYIKTKISQGLNL
jgi:uncharacterized membrane protein YcaP (DUF421 family)